MGGLHELVHDVARLLALGGDEVEGLAVEAVLVRDVVHRVGDEVDRDDVGVAELRPDQGNPLG